MISHSLAKLFRTEHTIPIEKRTGEDEAKGKDGEEGGGGRKLKGKRRNRRKCDEE